MKYPVQAARILGGSLREKLREDIRDDAIPEVIQIATKAALGIELPLLATAAKFGRQAAEVSAQALRARRMLHSSENLSSPSEHLAVDARSLANEIRRLSKAGMPVIIAIDDLQDAHPEIFALLDSLLSADRVDDAPILVVATTTTEAFRTPGMLRNEYAWLEDRHRTHLVTLPAFGEAEMIQLLRQVAPRTADSQARRVVRHCGSPLVLWALLLSGGFQKYRRHPNIVGDAVVISDDELHELPFSISSLIRHRWDEIPARTRDILMLCAFASPIGQEAGDHIIWHDDVIEELLQVLDLGLDNGHTLIRESGLVRSCGEGVSTFADPSLADVALNASREVFAERRSSIRRTIARSVDRRLNEVWEGFDCVSLGLEYLDGFSKGDEPLVSGEWRDRVVVARLTLCFEVGDHESILKIAEEFDNKGWPGSIGLYVRAKSVLLDSLIEVGRIPQAFNLAVALINEGVVAEPYTPDMPDDKLVLDLRIAQIIGENGQPEYAVLALQNLLEAMTRHGATPEELASVHNALAIWLSETGQAEEALRHYDLALSSASPSSTDGLVVRQNRAATLAQTGQAEAAIAEFEEVVIKSREVRGNSHPETLRAEHSFLALCPDRWSAADRIVALGDLVERATASLGIDHQTTVRAWLDLARLLVAAGEARRGREVLLERYDLVRAACSAGNTLVHAAEIEMSRALAELGEYAAAISWAESAFYSLRAKLPPDVRGVTEASTALLLALTAAGRAAEAISLWSPLGRNLPVLGTVDHLIVLRKFAAGLRNNGFFIESARIITELLETPGAKELIDFETRATLEYERAAGILAAGQDKESFVLLDTAEIYARRSYLSALSRLGALHPSTLRILTLLISALRLRGTPEEGLDLSRELVGSALEAYGPDSSEWYDARSEQIFVLGASRRFEEAIAETESLLLDCVGSDRLSIRERLTLQHNAAAYAYLLGNLEGATERLTEVLSARSTQLGEDDPDTVASRNMLATIRQPGLDGVLA